MGVGITPGDEKGVCSVCKKIIEVKKVVDEDAKKGFEICQSCADKSTLTVDECMEKYGKKVK